MRARIYVTSIVGIVSLLAVGQVSAQVRTPRAPGPRLPPAPVPRIAQVFQLPQRIFAAIEFEAPPNTVGIQVFRQIVGDAPHAEPLTPNIQPLNGLFRPSSQFYQWEDNTLRAPGRYAYLISAVMDDGSTRLSTWAFFTSQTYEATNVSVSKANSYTAVIEFSDGQTPARTYRLFDAGRVRLLSSGIEATKLAPDPMQTGWHFKWRVVVGNLAAGTHNWILRAEFTPNVQSPGIPVSITLP